MKTEMIAAMESVLSRLGEISGVEPGDAQGLIEWAEESAALRARLSQAERLAEVLEHIRRFKEYHGYHGDDGVFAIAVGNLEPEIQAALTAWEAGQEQSNG